MVRRGDARGMIDTTGIQLGEPNWMTFWEDRRFDLGLIPVQNPCASASKDNNLLEVETKPGQLSLLDIGKKLIVTIRYTNATPNPVRIWVPPLGGGKPMGGISSGSPEHAPGRGETEHCFF